MGTPQQLLNATGTNLWTCKYGLQAIPSTELSFPASFFWCTFSFTHLFQTWDFSWTKNSFSSLMCYPSHDLHQSPNSEMLKAEFQASVKKNQANKQKMCLRRTLFSNLPVTVFWQTTALPHGKPSSFPDWTELISCPYCTGSSRSLIMRQRSFR